MLTAAIFLAYAVGKAVYASQARLGLPTGPVVPAHDYEKYAGATLGVAANQWLATATGVVGAAIVLVSATAAGRALPRRLMLAALGLAFIGMGAGAAVMIVDGFVGIGIGWRWYHGLVGVVTLVAFSSAIRSYARATRPAPPRSSEDPTVRLLRRSPRAACARR